MFAWIPRLLSSVVTLNGSTNSIIVIRFVGFTLFVVASQKETTEFSSNSPNFSPYNIYYYFI